MAGPINSGVSFICLKSASTSILSAAPANLSVTVLSLLPAFRTKSYTPVVAVARRRFTLRLDKRIGTDINQAWTNKIPKASLGFIEHVNI